jgi:hypothetical protein
MKKQKQFIFVLVVTMITQHIMINKEEHNIESAIIAKNSERIGERFKR